MIARKTYYKYDAVPDLTQINSLEMMRTLSELTALTSGEMKSKDAVTYKKYSGTTSVPKFILYSGHARNVASIMTAFDQGPLIVYPPASSAMFFQFSECTDAVKCGFQGKKEVKVWYTEDAYGDEGYDSWRLLEFGGYTRSDGWMAIADF